MKYFYLWIFVFFTLSSIAQISGFLGKKNIAGVEITALPSLKSQKGFERSELSFFRDLTFHYGIIRSPGRILTVAFSRYKISVTNANLKMEGVQYKYPEYDPYNPMNTDNFNKSADFFPFEISVNSVSAGYKFFLNKIAPVGRYIDLRCMLYMFSPTYTDTVKTLTWTTVFAKPVEQKNIFNSGLYAEYGRNSIFSDRVILNTALRVGLNGFLSKREADSKGLTGFFSFPSESRARSATNEDYFEKLGNRRLYRYNFINFKIGIAYLFKGRRVKTES